MGKFLLIYGLLLWVKLFSKSVLKKNYGLLVWVKLFSKTILKKFYGLNVCVILVLKKTKKLNTLSKFFSFRVWFSKMPDHITNFSIYTFWQSWKSKCWVFIIVRRNVILCVIFFLKFMGYFYGLLLWVKYFLETETENVYGLTFMG